MESATGEPVVLTNNVPFLERMVVVMFVLVGSAFVWLAWTEPEPLPDALVPILRFGLPVGLVLLVQWAWTGRQRLRSTFFPGGRRALIEERKLWSTWASEIEVLGFALEEGTDSEGDAYAKLVVRATTGDEFIVSEGHDIDRLRAAASRLEKWTTEN